MAHGQNAAKHAHNREYWSRRLPRAGGWGKSWKIVTHRRERNQSKVLIRMELAELSIDP